ncbi:Dirigent protein 21 [Orobanche minor]
MAITTTLKLKPIIFTILFFAPALIISSKPQKFSRNFSKKRIGREKLSHLHFYFHDIVGGRHPTAVPIAQSAITNTSATGFGFVLMIDDPLTVGPEKGSRIVGRAQGMYGSADLTNLGLLMVLNFAFTEGKFNGSTLSVLGRNAVFSAVRELPIVGGSGVFRFARGYAQAKTRTFNLRTKDAVVEYNVYVFHY